MQAIVRITSELENSVFGQFNGIYIGNQLNLRYSSEGKCEINMNLNSGDKVIVDYNPIKSIINNLKKDDYYDVNSLGFITGGNTKLPATLTLTGLNFSYSELESE